jgi:TatD DNase family protein
MMLIDTHTHLYSKEFKDDIETVIKKAEQEGVTRFYLPAIDSSVIEAMLQLEKQYQGKCIAMMGLHPCYVKENYEHELKIIENWINKRTFAAIGEIGLDFYWDRSFEAQQYIVFSKQIEWAIQKQMPVVIHSRNSTPECIDLIKEKHDGKLKGIFHCFSGSYELAKKIIDMGFYLGIGGVLTYKNAELAGIINKVGIEHLVLETDAPYLSPVPFRGKRNESSYLKYIAEKLAAIKNITVEEVAAITTANAKKIFVN